MIALFRVVILTIGVLAYVAAGSAASAERLGQAATATPVPTSAATPVPCVVPPSGVVLILQNPSPGDTLLSGTQVTMSGIAYDTRADTGTGIQSVVLYLGARDAGGTSLGTALLGQPNPTAAPGSQFAAAGFKVTTSTIPSGSGAKSIFVYARSLVDGSETTLEVPIFLNAAPTPVKGQVPTPVLPPPPTCTPTPVPTATTAPTSTPVAAAAATATSTPVGVPTPTPAPAGPAPLPPAPAPAAAPPAAPTPVAIAPATVQAVAPAGGGMPPVVGLLLVGAGVVIVGGGVALRRIRR